MSTITKPGAYTPEDLLAMPDRKSYELVNGRLVELNSSALSSLVSANLLHMIAKFCEAHIPAWIFGAGCGYQCFPGHSSTVRKPDGSLIRRERLPVEQITYGFLRIAPDLAVEVVSPNDLACEIEEKVREYLEAGVRLVWVVYPSTRTVYIHRGDGTIARAAPHDDLDGEGIVPGFRCRVADIFSPLPAPGPAPTA